MQLKDVPVGAVVTLKGIKYGANLIEFAADGGDIDACRFADNMIVESYMLPIDVDDYVEYKPTNPSYKQGAWGVSTFIGRVKAVDGNKAWVKWLDLSRRDQIISFDKLTNVTMRETAKYIARETAKADD